MIRFKNKGDFSKTTRYIGNAIDTLKLSDLDRYGQAGVTALKLNTPVDSGNTAEAWDYKITRTLGGVKITFTNSNINDGVPIAIILQYGHGTRNGGYVQGRDYINPAIQPVFDLIADNAWKEVTKL